MKTENGCENTDTWKRQEWDRCSQSNLYFLKTYGKIRDPDLGIIDFKDWPHLVRLLDVFTKHREIIILKARQLGVSWLCAGYALWKVLFFEGARVLMLSQGEDEAADLLAKSTFTHDQLPPFLQLSKGKDQTGLVTFPAMHSEIRALPSTEKAGRGYGASLIIRDEVERHPYAEENFAAVGPSVDRGLAQDIDLSTANKLKLDTHFKVRYIQARHGENDACPVFLSVREREATLQGISFDDWFANIKRKYPAWMVEQEYPLTEKEALETIKSLDFFSEASLSQMYQDVMKPLEHELSDKYKTVKIYRLPYVGGRYCLFTDPSEGKEDPHVIIVMSVTGEQVAESHGKTPADMCAQIHDSLVRLYGNALNCWESGPGGAGGIMSVKLEELGTPNRCPSLNVASRPFKLDIKKKGWWTSKTLFDVLIWELEEAVRLRQIIPHSKECLDEFGQFKMMEGLGPQKTPGGHDDYVDAWARVWHLRKYMQSEGIKVTHLQYR